jgi:DNA-binding NtrC family response regulator
VVQQVTKKNHLRFAGFTDDATDVLMRYHWPGNIRELKNAIESMLIMEGGKTLHGDDVKKYLQEPSQVIADRNLPVVSNKSVEQAERELIYRALVDLKASIVEIQDMLSHKVAGASNFQPLAPDGGAAAVTMDEMERRMIQQALDRNNGSRRMAARELHISERSLYRKIKYYGLLG